MPDTVCTNHARHSSSNEVYAHIRNGYTNDSDAAAIASWYASPSGHGMVFQALAQGGHVQPSYLAAAIAAERTLPNTYAPDMDALSDWLDNTPRHAPISTPARIPSRAPSRGRR